MRAYEDCNTAPCDPVTIDGVAGEYKTMFTQFWDNGGIPSEWLHQYCMPGSCDYYGDNGDIMLFTNLGLYPAWKTGGDFAFKVNFESKLSKNFNKRKQIKVVAV